MGFIAESFMKRQIFDAESPKKIVEKALNYFNFAQIKIRQLTEYQI
jgi:hypothetical protein